MPWNSYLDIDLTYVSVIQYSHDVESEGHKIQVMTKHAAHFWRSKNVKIQRSLVQWFLLVERPLNLDIWYKSFKLCKVTSKNSLIG